MDLRLARLALHNEALTPPEQADIGGNAWSFVPVAVALPPQAGAMVDKLRTMYQASYELVIDSRRAGAQCVR